MYNNLIVNDKLVFSYIFCKLFNKIIQIYIFISKFEYQLKKYLA